MAKSSKNATLDSGRQHLGTVYAKALVGAAESQGQTEAVLAELGSVVDDVLAKLPLLEEAFATPRLALEEKLALLDKAFAGQMSPTLLNFLKVVAKHERLDCLRAIRRAAERLYNRMRDRVEVLVETAAPLNNTVTESIIARLTQLLGKQVVLTTEVNPDLLGGLVVRIGDTVYDGSLSGQLSRMQGVTLEQTTQQIRKSLEKFAVA